MKLEREAEYGLSQLFMAFDLRQLSDQENTARIIREITGSLTDTTPMTPGEKVYHPGQRSWLRRQENLEKGIPVDRDTWALIKKYAG